MRSTDSNLRTHIIAGFACVIILILGLSISGVFAMRNISANYSDLLDYSQKRINYVLLAESRVKDMRRINVSLIAYCGDVEKLNQYKSEMTNTSANVSNILLQYIDLSRNDTQIIYSERNNIVTKSEEIKNLLTELEINLISPNIEKALAGDQGAVLENTEKNAPLIANLTDKIQELLLFEHGVNTRLIADSEWKKSLYTTIYIAVAVFTVLISLCTLLLTLRKIGKQTKVIKKEEIIPDSDSSARKANYCPHCGNNLTPDMMFCDKCGRKSER